MIDGDRRYPVYKVENGYMLTGQEKVLTKEEIKEWIEDQPETVSTNVVTRPIFQDILFPTIAYVGGPGETAYFAQYQEVYKLFYMEMPIIYPRISITLIEKAIAKSMQKYNMTLLEVFHQFDAIRDKYLSETDTLNVKVRFAQIKKMLTPEYQKLIQDLQKLDPKFKKMGSQNLQRLIEEMGYLEDKAHHQHRKNSELFKKDGLIFFLTCLNIRFNLFRNSCNWICYLVRGII
ncbi:MAG: bacillithiol biosynthesis BshC [Halanaerobiales bacterium]|nr:bacillithiol biosynthesis BshC [Halanaerobiales bacterium]